MNTPAKCSMCQEVKALYCVTVKGMQKPGEELQILRLEPAPKWICIDCWTALK